MQKNNHHTYAPSHMRSGLDQAARVHICSMGFAGSMMPFFRPNFDNVEQLRQELNQGQELASGGGDCAGKGSSNRIDVREDSDGSKIGSSVGGRGGGVLGQPVGAVLAFIPTGWGAKAGAKNQSSGTISNTNSGNSNSITATSSNEGEGDDEGVEVQFSANGGLGPARHHNGITVQVASH